MKLIRTKDYLLLIDEEAKIKMDDYCVNLDRRISHLPISVDRRNIGGYGSNKYYWSHKKIIAYYPLTKEAKELDLPLLPPFEEINIEKLAKKHFEEHLINDLIVGFIEGYKASQSKQFSLEDMNKAMIQALHYGFALRSTALKSKEDVEENFLSKSHNKLIIQSLSTQQLPKEFDLILNDGILDVPYSKIIEINGNINWGIWVVKTITNSKGKEELVGTYKY